MSHHQQPDTRTWVLRWLLAALTLAGIGIVSGGHCLTDTLPPAVTATGVAPATPAHTATVTPRRDDHAHRAGEHTSSRQTSDTAAADCHVQPAPSTASTLTTATMAHPPAGIRGLPASAARPPADTSRPACAVALIDIGVSRT